jgi:hypothetical protein
MAKRNNREIRIRGVSGQVVADLNNIAENMGVPLSDFLKPKLQQIIESCPERFKKPPTVQLS